MKEVIFRRPLLGKVRRRSAKIAIFGLGAVGLKVAISFAGAGFNCSGIDIDSKLVEALNRGGASGHGLKTRRQLAKYLKNGKLSAKTDVTLTENDPDFLILCLPTPLTEDGEPNLSFLTDTCRRLGNQKLRNKCVILESSVYPGVTRRIVKPCLESGGFVAGADFALAHSPERIDLNNSRFPMERIPKLVGGINEASTDVAVSLYEAVLRAHVIRVDNPETAEAAKMLENTYRFVNISLVNELSQVFETLGVDTFAAVNAASSKPFGFMPHFPGPGVGGHCIPKDPFYMLHAAKLAGKQLKIVEAAVLLNQQMPIFIAARIEQALSNTGKSMNRARIAVLGLGYKRNMSDSRRSPAVPLISELSSRGAQVGAYDPLVSHSADKLLSEKRVNSLEEAVQGADVIVLVTDHDAFRRIDLAKIRKYLATSPILFDARNFWRESEATRLGYSYIGLGKPSKQESASIP